MVNKPPIILPADITKIFLMLLISTLNCLIWSQVCFCIIRHSFSWLSILWEAVLLALLGIIDFKEESDRLIKNLAKVNKEIEKVTNKLNSDNFIENAPKNIISEQKWRLEEYMSSESKIEDAIKSFSN